VFIPESFFISLVSDDEYRIYSKEEKEFIEAESEYMQYICESLRGGF